MKQKILSLIAILSIYLAANAQVSNTQADFSCPGQVTVTYDLISTQPINVTLYYSPNKCDWLIAATVTGDLFAQTTGPNKTIIWNNYADNVRFGKFYFKVEIPPPVFSCEDNGGVIINGICWARSNVDMPGTFAPNPEDFGMLYQWGSNIGWSSIGPLAATDGINTWRDLSESGDVWLPGNNPCPAGWRVPTQQEFQSLVNLGSYWDNLNGINGRFFGGGLLFLPAAGHRSYIGGTRTNMGIRGYYWSSTINSSTNFYLEFYNTYVSANTYNLRAFGFSVRCVAGP